MAQLNFNNLLVPIWSKWQLLEPPWSLTRVWDHLQANQGQDKIAGNVGCCFLVTDVKIEAVGFNLMQGFAVLDYGGNQATGQKLMFSDLVDVLG